MLNISSNRHRFQEAVEGILGCQDPSKISDYKSAVENYVILPDQVDDLLQALRFDAKGAFFKAALSYSEAVSAISKGHESWAVVKLYYSVFYLLRCLFAARGIGFFKCRGIYTVRVSAGEGAVKRDKGKYKGGDVRGDHKTIICVYESVVGVGDYLLSNKLGEMTVFDWMMKAREDVNYRLVTFLEPGADIFGNFVREKGVGFWVDRYLSDEDGVYIFQQAHCCLATPLWLFRQVRKEFETGLSIDEPLTQEQYEFLEGLVAGTGLERNSSFLCLFKGGVGSA